MKRLAWIVLASVGLAGCGFFSEKMNQAVAESSKVINAQADSLKKDIIKARATEQFDAAFAAKMDTLCHSGFKLADLAETAQHDKNDTTAFRRELAYFSTYVNKNFDYNDRISQLLPTLSLGLNMEGQDIPMGLNATRDMLYVSAKSNIMQIIILCREQYKPAS